MQYRFALRSSHFLLSLPMDFDLNATLNTQAAIYASDEQARPQPTAAPPTGIKRSASPAPDTSLKKPKTHTALPVNVILTIADHLPAKDIPAFSLLDKRTYHLMEERRWAARCTKQARNVCDFASWQQLIEDIERIQAGPELRVEPLLALSTRLIYLPPQQRVEAFKRLFVAAEHIPEQGFRIQKRLLLSQRSYTCPQSIFDFAYAMAERRRPDQENFWPELAELLGEVDYRRFNSQAPQRERYQALLNRLAHLDPSEQAKLIPLLADRLTLSRGNAPDSASLALLQQLAASQRGSALDAAIRDSPEAEQAVRRYAALADPRLNESNILSAYVALLQQTQSLPPSQQGASVGALAAATRVLPEAERAVRYAEMRQLALSLSDEQLGMALRRLPLSLIGLPPEQHAHELQLLEPALLRVLPAQRVQAALGLLECSPYLNDVLSKQVWQRALQLLDGSSEAELLELFSDSRLMSAIEYSMHGGKRSDAVNEILAFVERNHVTEPTRAMIFAHMPLLCSAMGTIGRHQVALALLRYSYQLDDMRSKQVWQLMLRLFNGYVATEILDVLSKARQEGVTTAMSDQKWQDAVNEITAFTERSRLNKSSRATILAHIPWLRNPNLERPRQQRLELETRGNECQLRAEHLPFYHRPQ
ncbi:hypothetical protein [Mycetohabitans sp. B4]|uniref:F-box domain-containing protein n=1 Tax=Mycetohabitans sp. TaxID=2571162 RepID=A0A6B9HF55_9BURK|nr:hypothetical protein [Mycetohabitans sp. B4]MCG1018044.1 hypothetical protein [Mycetohabitans sp. B4]QGY72784.1 hypothetical protein [Mycetohabitans sp.]